MATPGLRSSILVVLLSLVSIGSTPTLAQSRLTERVLTTVGRDDAGFFASPRLGAEQLRFLLALIARSARVPIGFEEVAGVPTPYDGNLSTVPLSARTVLIGLTVGEALDALVAADPIKVKVGSASGFPDLAEGTEQVLLGTRMPMSRDGNRRNLWRS